MELNDLSRDKLILRRHEGLKLTPYKCPAGHTTIGYGHNLDAGRTPEWIKAYLLENGRITYPMAECLLDMDVKEAFRQAVMVTHNWEDLSWARTHVIINMIFNMGIKKYKRFEKFREAIEKEDFEAATSEMKSGSKPGTYSKWYRELGGDPDGTDDGRLERPEELIKMMKEG